MSYNNGTGWFKMLFVFMVTASLIGAGLVVSAQNANSQEETTRGSSMTTTTTNTTTTTHRRSRRGRRRSRAANANTGDMGTMSNENTGGTMQENTNTGGEMTGNTMTGNMGMGRRHRRGRRGSQTTGMANANEAGTETTMTATANANNMGGEQTDLSGTYTGTFNCGDAGATGDGTLTISGNSFTWTGSGGDTKTGRITAVTTRGYTGVAMQFGEATAPAPGQTATPPVIVSMRARKMGDRLSLTTVPNAMHVCSFTPTGGGGGGGRRHGRRHSRGAMPATPAEPATPPAEPGTGATPAEPATPATPARRRGRRGRRGGNMNGNMDMGGNMNSNTMPPGGRL